MKRRSTTEHVYTFELKEFREMIRLDESEKLTYVALDHYIRMIDAPSGTKRHSDTVTIKTEEIR